MVLIVGGEGSGKRSFAKTLGFASGQMADGVLDERPVVYHVEKMVFADVQNAPALYEPLCEKQLVLCCEVGSGVIPAEYETRLAREAVGRLCVRLAAHADCVVRMVCGIPTVIKGELPCSLS